MTKPKFVLENVSDLTDDTEVSLIQIIYKNGETMFLWTVKSYFSLKHDGIYWRAFTYPQPLKINLEEIMSVWVCENTTLGELKQQYTEEGYEIVIK